MLQPCGDNIQSSFFNRAGTDQHTVNDAGKGIKQAAVYHLEQMAIYVLTGMKTLTD